MGYFLCFLILLKIYSYFLFLISYRWYFEHEKRQTLAYCALFNHKFNLKNTLNLGRKKLKNLSKRLSFMKAINHLWWLLKWNFLKFSFCTFFPLLHWRESHTRTLFGARISIDFIFFLLSSTNFLTVSSPLPAKTILVYWELLQPDMTYMGTKITTQTCSRG